MDAKTVCPLAAKTELTLTHARIEPAHCLAPGLFRSLGPGDRRASKLAIKYQFAAGETVEFVGPEPLGADDLRVLQGLVALCGPHGRVLGAEPYTERGRELRSAMELLGQARSVNAITIRSSFRQLAREVGLADPDGGSAHAQLRACIKRLSSVTIHVTHGSRWASFHLLAAAAGDDADGRLYVALNPRLAGVILNGGRYARIELGEVRRLKSPVARLLHHRLCAMIDPGRRRPVSIDRLVTYVWPAAATPATRRQHRHRLLPALAELLALGWTVTASRRDVWMIGRPALRD